MLYDSRRLGDQQVTPEDLLYQGSRYSEVRDELFRSAYYMRWKGEGEPPLPTYGVTLGRVLRGVLPGGSAWHFREAAKRALKSPADMRWGADGRGYRRLLHPNGVCLFGEWRIEQPTPYSGYFSAGSRALVIGRYSTCCTETRANRFRSLSLVGKLYPTTDPNHSEPLRTANFITQEDLGGTLSRSIDEVELVNAPDTTPWRRKGALPVLLVTGLVFLQVDREPAVRQLYPISELGLAPGERSWTPQFMRLRVVGSDGEPLVKDAKSRQSKGRSSWGAWFDYPRDAGEDFRDEILGRLYDPGTESPRKGASLRFSIEVTDHSTLRGRVVQRRSFPQGWTRIGTLEFTDAVASYAGDHVIHFAHPRWREKVDDPQTTTREPALPG